MKDILKNSYFWTIIIIGILGFVIILILGLDPIKQGYLLISNIDAYECSSDYSCNKIENDKILNDEKKNYFTLYENQNYLGEYSIDYINKWTFFDKNGKWLNINSNFIAGSKQNDLQVQFYEKRKMNATEIEMLTNILKDNNISNYSYLDQNEVIEYDFNNDNSREKIILASNVAEDINDDKLFAIALAIINNKAQILHLDIYNRNEKYLVPIYNIKGIINIFGQDENILILLKGYFSEVGTPSSFLYKVEHKKFKDLTTMK